VHSTSFNFSTSHAPLWAHLNTTLYGTRREVELKKEINLVIPNSYSNDKKGNFFEEFTGILLNKLRYEIIERIRFTGMEIDLIANNKDTQERRFVECKFQNDPIGAGVITDLLGKAIIKNIDHVFLFSLSELGKEAKGILDEYNSTDQKIKFTFFNPKKIYEIYIEQNNIIEPKNVTSTGKNGSLYINIFPDFDYYVWLKVILKDGVPFEGLITSDDKNFNFRDISRSLKNCKSKLFSDLKFTTSISKKSSNEDSNDDEIISSINVADSFDDYRPCRPADYVGREELQKNIWDYLEKVRQRETTTRIISLTGASGFGKSSTIIKLSERFTKAKWKNKFYLFHIDVRSAKSSLYIYKSIKNAIDQCVKDSFLDKKHSKLKIENINNIFNSDAMNDLLSELKEHNKVLVIFFDQFEELFTKVELFSAFEAFKNLCLEVDSLNENIVLGFSWRTGISFNDSHPAYHLWHDLSDKRKEFVVKPLNNKETSSMITKFEKNKINSKLDRVVRRRISEQCQGLPWLLKKLLVHIGNQVEKGKNQNDLIVGKFNIKPLFDEDLEKLSNDQIECLKYIANNSPIDLNSILEHFKNESINSLYSIRLIIRSGHKYSVYWDIFRDFLKNGDVPNIPLTYLPKTSPNSIIKVLRLFEENSNLSLDELIESSGYSNKSAMNILSDCLMFNLIIKEGNGKYKFNNELEDEKYIRKYLYDQLIEHVVVHALEKIDKSNQICSIDSISSVINDLHKDEEFSKNSLKQYTNSIIKWFQWAAVLTLKNSKVQINYTPDFDSSFVLKSRKGNITGNSTFRFSTGPKQIKEFITIHIQELIYDSIYVKKHKNVIADLRSLEILQKNNLSFTNELKSKDCNEIYEITILRAKESEFIKLVYEDYLKNPERDYLAYNKLFDVFGNDWSDGSKKRYVNAGKRWIKDIYQQVI
jgi:Novel STAND NTPase 1/Restriction endonuclease